jgi:hypothetical protein
MGFFTDFMGKKGKEFEDRYLTSPPTPPEERGTTSSINQQYLSYDLLQPIHFYVPLLSRCLASTFYNPHKPTADPASIETVSRDKSL